MLGVKKTEGTQAVQSHVPLVASELPVHALPALSVASMLGVDPAEGLHPDEVEKRRAKYGANALETIRPVSAWRILLSQFRSLIVALLALAAMVAWVTSSHVEALAIIVVLALNAIVGFVTEWKASQALDALRRQSRTTARVERGGRQANIDAEELTQGDIIILNAGDRVPADARLIRSASLLADESVLTGESLTVDKSSEPVAPDAELAERRSMLYLSTTIMAGSAIAIVTATGVDTELGRIGKLVASTIDERTPLEIKLNELGRKLIYVSLAIAAVVMITGWLRGDGFWMMIEVGISLAVAAVPEGLPAVTTLILALGVLRMARERAIVRRLPAVETLGSTSVICADKTGTLTQNRLTVREWRLSDGKLIDLCDDNYALEEDDLLSHALRVTVLCNEASLTDDACAVGDPTETALLMAAARLGADIRRARAEYPKLNEVPFDAASKRMITTHQGPSRSRIIVLKGAPAVVLEASTNYVGRNACVRPLNDEKRAELMAVNNEMAGRALRVLALAEKYAGEDSVDSDMDSGYTFLARLYPFLIFEKETADSVSYKSFLQERILYADLACRIYESHCSLCAFVLQTSL